MQGQFYFLNGKRAFVVILACRCTGSISPFILDRLVHAQKKKNSKKKKGTFGASTEQLRMRSKLNLSGNPAWQTVQIGQEYRQGWGCDPRTRPVRLVPQHNLCCFSLSLFLTLLRKRRAWLLLNLYAQIAVTPKPTPNPRSTRRMQSTRSPI